MDIFLLQKSKNDTNKKAGKKPAFIGMSVIYSAASNSGTATNKSATKP